MSGYTKGTVPPTSSGSAGWRRLSGAARDSWRARPDTGWRRNANATASPTRRALRREQVQARLTGHAALIEFACRACAFDQAPPPLVPAILADDLTAAGQRTVTGAVGQRPVPRLPLQLPASAATGPGPLGTPPRPGGVAPRLWRNAATGLLRGQLSWARFLA